MALPHDGIQRSLFDPAQPTIDPQPELPVRVIRSARRRRTVQARMVDGVLEVLIPAWASRADEARFVDSMQQKFRRTRRSDSVDLAERSRVLAQRHGLERPASIRWVGNMEHRWGSCTTVDRAIRISDRLAHYPSWVLDAVIVHEMAHLTHPNHSKAFWALANRYPYTERARGYLMCAAAPPGNDGTPRADGADVWGDDDADEPTSDPAAVEVSRDSDW